MLSLPFSGRFCLTNFLSASPVHLNCFNDQRVRGLEGVLCQMDDVLIFGSDKAQHDQRLTAVLKRLQATGLTLNSEKCVCKNPCEVPGTCDQPDPEKISAIVKMTVPHNVPKLRCFLRMVNQLGKLSPRISELTQPLRELPSSKRS